jgi:hypothetical protein
MIKLRGWIIFICPGLATVGRNAGSSIIGGNHPLRIIGIYPKIVVITMRHIDVDIKSFPSIYRFIKIYIQAIDGFRIERIGVDTGIIEGTLP